MAGYKNNAVVKALESRLAEQVEVSKTRHMAALQSWEKERAEIQRAKKNLRQAVRDLTEGKIEIEAFAKRIEDSAVGYRRAGWAAAASRPVPKPPVLERSANERTLERLIGLVKSATGDELSVTELTKLGILGWVKA